MTTKARGRAGRPKDQEKGSAILDAGWALFLERGVGAVSIEAIAARAGVSKMTVYGHFTDKHALFEAAVAREMRGIEAAQQLESDTGPVRPIEERLRAFGIGLLTFLHSQPAVDFYNILSGELRRHPDLARRFYDAGPGRTLANLAAMLASAPDQVAIGDPAEAAEALFGLWQGASNYQVSLGVETADNAEAIGVRVERGIALFMRAYERRKAVIPTERFEQVQVESLDELAAWLAANHARDEGVWLVRFKKSMPHKFINRLDVIDELLRFGWVDGIARKLDDERTMQLIFPRKQQAWAQSYKDRAARLEAEGRMEEPGRAAIERSKRLGMWDAYAPVDALLVPDDLRAALRDRVTAEAFFDGAAPSYRRNVLRWIAQAKRPETRARRIMTTAELSSKGDKVPQM